MVYNCLEKFTINIAQAFEDLYIENKIKTIKFTIMEYSLFAVYSLLVSILTMGVMSTTPELRELDKFIKHAMKCNKVVGLSVSLVKGGNTIFSRGYGHVSGEGPDFKERASEHSEFCIGSLTKAFTSTVIADVLSKQER